MCVFLDVFASISAHVDFSGEVARQHPIRRSGSQKVEVTAHFITNISCRCACIRPSSNRCGKGVEGVGARRRGRSSRSNMWPACRALSNTWCDDHVCPTYPDHCSFLSHLRGRSSPHAHARPSHAPRTSALLGYMLAGECLAAAKSLVIERRSDLLITS